MAPNRRLPAGNMRAALPASACARLTEACRRTTGSDAVPGGDPRSRHRRHDPTGLRVSPVHRRTSPPGASWPGDEAISFLHRLPRLIDKCPLDGVPSSAQFLRLIRRKERRRLFLAGRGWYSRGPGSAIPAGGWRSARARLSSPTLEVRGRQIEAVLRRRQLGGRRQRSRRRGCYDRFFHTLRFIVHSSASTWASGALNASSRVECQRKAVYDATFMTGASGSPTNSSNRLR